MCGFSGVLFTNSSQRDSYRPGQSGFRQCAHRVAHRGDSDHQELFLTQAWLSHFRLAFQDVQAGRQPMLSADRSHVIVFNGEVYNHLGLRDSISRESGINFQTRSDTETILEGWLTFGEALFERLEGEYAFVILATDGSRLIAHRDRYGVKPLFLQTDQLDTQPFAFFQPSYEFSCQWLEFASEIKGLASPKHWLRDGLLRQFVGLYEPIRTPFEKVIQIPPGGILRASNSPHGFACELQTFAQPLRREAHGHADHHRAEARFAELLGESVQDRLLSDVELGVYLSGGIDSKVIAHELHRLGTEAGASQMKSFTVGFTQQGYDETSEALRFARHCGLQPHVVEVDGAALNYAYPLAVQNSELVQPFTNGAAKWWLSLFARQYVHGVLTGDGADELLCGYPSYRYVNWWKFVTRARGEANSVREIQALLQRSPLGSQHRDSLYLQRFAAHGKNPWLAGSSAAGSGEDFVESLRILGVPHPLFSQIRAIANAVLGEASAEAWLQKQAASVQSWFYAGLEHLGKRRENPSQSLLLWQNYFARTHLPSLILNWVGDRMEMANTLEGRTPFLSNRLRQFVQQLPDHLLVSGLRDKVLLRRAYAPKLGAEFTATPKKQFNAPFLDSQALAQAFQAEEIFARTGLNPELAASDLIRRATEVEQQDPYLATHIRSAYQTALAASIVDSSIVAGHAIDRDPELEKRYLSPAGAR